MEGQQKPRFGPVTRVCLSIFLSLTTGDLLPKWKASCTEVPTTISVPLTTNRPLPAVSQLTKDRPSQTDSLTITPPPPYLQSNMKGLTDICPYSTFCTVGPKAQLSAPNRSCCMECSCHPYCWTIGTCCPDMPEEKLSRNTHSCDLTVQCQTQYELYNQHRRIPFNNDLAHVSYRVIDSCFMKGTNQSCFDNSDLEDYITVSDVKEEFIFKNRKCAACNGFTDIVRWSFSFWCKELVEMELTSIATVNNYILSNCGVQSYPPSSLTGIQSLCLPSIGAVDKCNRTRDWNVYNERHAKLCENFQQVYFNSQKKSTHTNIYKNAYCFTCNSQMENTTETCLEDDDDLFHKQLFSQTSFRSIMNLNLLEVSGERLDGQCSTDEIRDPFSATVDCRKLYCPRGFVAKDHECQRLDVSTIGYTFNVHIVVTVSQQLVDIMKSQPRVNKPGVTAFNDALMRVFNLGSLRCGVCSIVIYEDTNSDLNNTLHVNWVIYTTKDCDRFELAARLKSSSVEKLKGSIIMGAETWDIATNVKLFKFEKSTAHKLISHYGFNRCSDVIDFDNVNILFECPRIEVPRSVLDSQNINLSTILNTDKTDLFVVKPVHSGYANNTYLVCIDFYTSLFSKQTAPKFAFEQTFVYILAIMFFTACVTWF